MCTYCSASSGLRRETWRLGFGIVSVFDEGVKGKWSGFCGCPGGR
jgi:hypothetical protein